MKRRASGKVLLMALLAAIAVFSVFGAAWAADLKFSATTDQTEIGGNNGAITVGSPATTATTNAYYLKGHNQVTVVVKVEGANFTTEAGNVANLTRDNDAWEISPTSFSMGDTGKFSGTLTLTRKQAAGGLPAGKTETVTITATEINDAKLFAKCEIKVTLVEIEKPTLDPAKPLVLFYEGVKSDQTITVRKPEPQGVKINLAEVKLYRSLGDGRVTEVTFPAGIIWPGDDKVKAQYANEVLTLSAEEGAKTHPRSTYTLEAGGMNVENDKVGTTAAAVVSGETPFNIGSFEVEVRTPFVSPDVTERTFTVGEAVRWPSSYDFAVSAMSSSGATITGIAADSPNLTPELSHNFNGLSVALDKKDNKITFIGTPKEVGEKDFWIVGEAETETGTGAKIALTPAKLTVTVKKAETGGGGKPDEPEDKSPDMKLTLSSYSETFRAGENAFGTLTATGTEKLTGFTIARGAGNGADSLTWNGLTFATSFSDSKGTVSITGRPESTDTATFTLTGTSEKDEAKATFSVTVTQATGTETFNPDPVIYDSNGRPAAAMVLGETMQVVFSSKSLLTGVSVLVEQPNDEPGVDLPLRGAANETDGYSVSHPTPDTTDVTVFYQPQQIGTHTFKISYNDGGVQSTKSFALDAEGRSGSGGSSSGCVTGFGAAALLGLGGLAVLRRRVR